ncbi:hypothetical protein DYB28_010693 [Aphanomyces astaci]|uniref:DDE-1 domain-containing protein n=1 Tax=Aphanomyces astaci TaxID=112090 RepID=A0A9X8E993_APHAT|nr:hypothetical protein DYB28_010693 [Aphanomyces astaci]
MDVTPPARPPGRPRLKEGPKKPPKKLWIDSIRRQVKNSKSQNSTFKLQAPKRPTLVQWITEAWFGLSEAIITKGFAKCKIVHQDEAVDELSKLRFLSIYCRNSLRILLWMTRLIRRTI